MSIATTPLADELDRHRAECRRCTPWSVCSDAAKLLEQLADAVAPMPRKAADA